jgi:transposase
MPPLDRFEGEGAAVTIIVDTQRALTGGVDTHADVHVAAVIDPEGGLLGVKSFATNLAGYKLLSGWMGTFGEIGLVGVEGTGSYGAGLARHLHREGLVVVEVDRPNRQERSRQGKSDSLDAIEAARAALSGRAFGVAKTRDGNVEAIRALMVARRSARESRTKAINQIRQLVYTAPDELRERFVGVPSWRIAEGVAILRVHADADPVRMATKSALSTLGRRAVALGEEGKRLDVLIARLVDKVAPELVELVGLGPDTAALLLIAAGDNPSRLRSEATWAKLCGVAPLEASSGKVTRHRLNRGGDRQANHALWRIVLTRMSCHEETKIYVARRTAEGKSKREIMRVLKRYVAREVYHHLPRD